MVTEFIEGLVETYPGLQYLDGFPQVMVFFLGEFGFDSVWFGDHFAMNHLSSVCVCVQIKVVLRADVVQGACDKVAVISGVGSCVFRF